MRGDEIVLIERNVPTKGILDQVVSTGMYVCMYVYNHHLHGQEDGWPADSPTYLSTDSLTHPLTHLKVSIGNLSIIS